jgi:predicted dehydrogenase
MVSKEDPIVIMGAGSIGERYIHILLSIGYLNLHVYRQRMLPLRTVQENQFNTFAKIDDMDFIQPKAAIICTPTFQHVAQTIFCLERKIPVMVEKPLCHNLFLLDSLRRILVNGNTSPFRVAYMLRYHPHFVKIKSLIAGGELGRLLAIKTHWGEHLPDWHPWEDFKTSYAVSKKMGGGAALTLSHDVDLCNWLSGSLVEKWSRISNVQSQLSEEVDSASDIVIRYHNGVTANCHVNFFERVPHRDYRFIFADGTVAIDLIDHSLTIFHPNGVVVSEILSDFHRNQLYTAQLLDFFSQAAVNDEKRNMQQFYESQKIIEICR